jgi:hypothetical protein
MKRLVVGITVLVALACQPAGAVAQWRDKDQQPQRAWPSLEDPGARRRHVPYVRAATNCIAREIMSEPSLDQAYSTGDLGAALDGPIKRCWPTVLAMIRQGDMIYGPGVGRQFFEGPYFSDLPRAVMSVIKPAMQARQAEAAKAQAQAEAEAQAKADSEARIAEEKRKADEEEAKTFALQKEEEHKRQIAVSNSAMEIIRNDLYSCIEDKAKTLVSSGESGDVIASVAMTLCDDKVKDLIKSALDIYNIENDGAQISGDSAVSLFGAAARDKIKEQALAIAVQAKAAAK